MAFKYYSIVSSGSGLVIPRDDNASIQHDNPFEPGFKPIRKDYYPSEFYKIRNKVIDRFEGRCFLCNELANEIHHIDYNKMNNNINNLMLLCKYHHAQTNFNRNSWEESLKEKLKNTFFNYRKKEGNE